ncbi:hypothetical protein AB0K00_44500 [Dactylosporangium sp. NPDC049525]|uniref:hypothetical protein n=1 Tax=Dactylosporangium sp. NPDC049525 TaxID=3154730 RepID=UPI00344652E4
MPEQTDPTRELIRRAYAASSDAAAFDADGGLADVVRRAGLPGDQEGGTVTALAPRRARRRFAIVGTFAAAVVVILAVYAASAGTRPQQQVGTPPSVHAALTGTPGPTLYPSGSLYPSGRATPTNPSTSTYAGKPGASRYAGDDPAVLPSTCADSWMMALVGGEFTVTARTGSACGPLPVDRVWVLDAASGNGLINPGDAVIWPVVPVLPPGSGTRVLQPPFSFTPGGWSGPVRGHIYQLMYVDEAAALEAKPGDDSYAAFLNAHIISGYVIA